MYLLGVLALGFYALKIPERYFPGNKRVVLYHSKTEMVFKMYMYTVFRVFSVQANYHFYNNHDEFYLLTTNDYKQCTFFLLQVKSTT